MVSLYVGHRMRPIVAEDIVNGTILEDAVEDLVVEVVDHHNVIVQAKKKAVKMEPPPVVKEVAAVMDRHVVTDQDAVVEATLVDTIEVRIVDHHQAAIKMQMAMDRQEGEGLLGDSSAETSVVEEEAEDGHILKIAKIRLENRLVRMDPGNNHNVVIRVFADVAHHVQEAQTPSPNPVTIQTRRVSQCKILQPKARLSVVALKSTIHTITILC